VVTLSFRAAVLAALAAVLLVAAPAARAAVPFRSIQSAGPLTQVALGNEGSCQVAYRGDTRFELFPSSATPADCGTLIAVDGVLHAPNFASHDGTATTGLGQTAPFTPVSQSAVTGDGTSGSPFKVVTVYDVGASGLRVTQTDTYVVGAEVYRTEVRIANRGGVAKSGQLYRGGDCYLQESDAGFGFVDGAAPACALNANNAPAARIEQWFPQTPGSTFMEGSYAEVWAAIATQQPLPNRCLCDQAIDNGAAIAWGFSVAPGATATFTHLTVFSPRGVSGSQQPAATPPVFGPGGIIGAPSNRQCLSRRNFRIHIRPKRGQRLEQVIVFVNRRRVAVRRGRRVSAPVDLRGLPKGRYTVTITVITQAGDVLRGVRRYRTCTPRRRPG
jgi:hypothetical protein